MENLFLASFEMEGGPFAYIFEYKSKCFLSIAILINESLIEIGFFSKYK